MLGFRVFFLLGCFLATAGYGWWVTHPQGMRQHLRVLTAQAQKQDAQNRRLHQQNLALRREITALRYDRRAIEQAARDQLFLTQPDEIVILCPK